jgi:LmbE family N-acetylglucosaminyl deacetylase
MMFTSGDKALIVCAHLDDELFGVGGTIRRLIQKGVVVDVIVMTSQVYERLNSGKFQRKFSEVTAVTKAEIGISEYFWSGLVDTSVQNSIREHIAVLEDRIDHGLYQWIFTHTEHDLHQEHVLVSQATKIAARPNLNVFSALKGLFAYEVVGSSNSVFIGNTPPAALRVEIDINTKLDDLVRLSRVAIDEYPKARSLESVKALAILRGSEAKMGAAEAFDVLYLAERVV